MVGVGFIASGSCDGKYTPMIGGRDSKLPLNNLFWVVDLDEFVLFVI